MSRLSVSKSRVDSWRAITLSSTFLTSGAEWKIAMSICWSANLGLVIRSGDDGTAIYECSSLVFSTGRELRICGLIVCYGGTLRVAHDIGDFL